MYFNPESAFTPHAYWTLSNYLLTLPHKIRSLNIHNDFIVGGLENYVIDQTVRNVHK